VKGKRLGRGLEEISHVFLSSADDSELADQQKETPIPSSEKDFVPANTPTIGIMGLPETPLAIFTLANVSIELARQGHRVLVIDDDPGSLNVTRLMGLVDIESHAETIFSHAPMGVRVAYRTSVLNELFSRGSENRREKCPFWPENYRQFDFILHHLPCRKIEETGPLLKATSLCIAMAPGDSEGMLQTYRGIKDLHRRRGNMDLGLITVTDKGEEEAALAFSRMAENVKRFLHKSITSYSYLKTGSEIDESVEEGFPLVLKLPSSHVRQHIYNIAGLIIEDHIRGTA
jgi:cellulose biosynthesis protein BcsQ